MIFILAGTHAQAKHIAEDYCLGPKDWKFALVPSDLLGVRGGTLWLYGTWRERPYGGLMYDDALQREMQIKRPRDRNKP